MSYYKYKDKKCYLGFAALVVARISNYSTLEEMTQELNDTMSYNANRMLTPNVRPRIKLFN